MKWQDIAPYIGPTPNMRSGGMEPIEGVVLHIQQGNEAGSIAWCKNPVSQVSAHFFAPKTGRPVQMVDTADEAWAQAAGNPRWLSIENEGYSGQQLTADQIESCAQILARAHVVYGVALVATDDPSRGGLGWHGMGGDDWGGHPDCPGDPVKAQRSAIIARAAQLVGLPNPPATSAPRWPGRTLVYLTGVGLMNGADVREWQARMRIRGWGISVDGYYGPQSSGICRQFQQDSTAHGWYLQVDGIVGAHTWSAAWERPVS